MSARPNHRGERRWRQRPLAVAVCLGCLRRGLAVTVLIVWVALNATGIGSTASWANESSGQRLDYSQQPRPQDQVWLVSTRHLGYPVEGQQPNLDVRRYAPGDGWQESDVAEFFGDGQFAGITYFYVHGNRKNWQEAIDAAFVTYNLLLPQQADAVPLRMVIWSWPSMQIRGPLRDVRAKARRTNSDGYYLGWFLSQMAARRAGPPASEAQMHAGRISLLGYSYGARIITGALHLTAGGEMLGYRLDEPGGSTGPVRVALLAAALHNYWLYPNQFHEYALTQTDHLLLLYNYCDPALKRYRCVEKRGRPQALGYTGVCDLSSLDDRGQRVEQWNVCCHVGRSHEELRYYNSSSLVSRLRAHLLWQPIEAAH